MSVGAWILMVVILTIVWGGAALTLIAAWRQERRQNGKG